MGKKTFVITGATSGIGFAVAEQIREQGHNVIGIGRSQERNRAAEERIQRISSDGKVQYLLADLSLMRQVRNVAEEITSVLKTWKTSYLDGLLNNAANIPFKRTETVEGFEMQWALNYLSGFLLTDLLLKNIISAPHGCIVSVSSDSHYRGRFHWNDPQFQKGYNALRAYQHSKLMQVLFITELNRRLRNTPNVRAFAADPGLVNTDLGMKGNSKLMDFIWLLRRKDGISPQEAAQGITYLLLDESIQQSEHIYWKHSRPVKPNPRVFDEQAGRKLWEISRQMCLSHQLEH